MSKKSTKRPWRKLLKKQQRKRRRQKLASERDKRLEKEELAKLDDPWYQAKLQQQEQLENVQKLKEEEERHENEEQWLRRELLAQKAFKREEKIRLANEKQYEEIRQQQEKRLKEDEEALRRKKEIIQKQNELAAKEFEESMQLLEKYLENSSATPPHMQKRIETRPGEKICEFYSKTNCCRFGLACVYNHQNTMLSKIILIKHFFQHSYLDYRCHQDTASGDEYFEVNETGFQEDYAEFCSDVWPEMESFGVLVNFRTVRNKLAHNKGHVFVEFLDKRSALRAFVKLQNRYYASKALKVEFSHITNWRAAICGLFLAKKCPKGDSCNYLHIMQNPGNKYNAALGPNEKVQSELRSVEASLQTPLNWNDVIASEGNTKSQRWRWSESPEIEINAKKENLKLMHRSTKQDPDIELESSSNPHNLCKLSNFQSFESDSTTTKQTNEEKSRLKQKHKIKHKNRKKRSSKEKHKAKHKKRERTHPEEVKYKKDSRSSRSRSHCRYKSSSCDDGSSEKNNKTKNCSSDNHKETLKYKKDSRSSRSRSLHSHRSSSREDGSSEKANKTKTFSSYNHKEELKYKKGSRSSRNRSNCRYRSSSRDDGSSEKLNKTKSFSPGIHRETVKNYKSRHKTPDASYSGEDANTSRSSKSSQDKNKTRETTNSSRSKSHSRECFSKK